jgi:hypothetical protein
MRQQDATLETKKLRCARGSIQFLQAIPVRAVWRNTARCQQLFRVDASGNALGVLESFHLKTSPTLPPPQQRDRETEKQSVRESERQIYRDTDDTDVTDGSALSASVKTLPEAVKLSLARGITEDCLFRYARAIKAFEVTTRRKLNPEELSDAFGLWWNTPKPPLSDGAEYDEWRYDFLDSYAKARTPLGSNSLQVAIQRAKSEPYPAECERFTSSKIRLLVAVCYQLQRIAGDAPFFIGFRDVAKLTETKDLHSAMAKMNGLILDGILTLERRGNEAKANRYKYQSQNL